MGEYLSAIGALRRDIESAEAALTGANEAYADAERKLRDAQAEATRAYDGRARNQGNVDRLKKALAILEGDQSND